MIAARLRVAALAVSLGCTGCEVQTPEASPDAPVTETAPAEATAAAPEKTPAVAEPTTTSTYRSDLPVIDPLKQPVAESVASFQWTPTPTLEQIPDQPVTGQVNGQPFICQHAAVIPDSERGKPTVWLRLSSLPRGELCGLSYEDDSVSLEWHQPEGVGRWRKTMDGSETAEADAWYTVEQADGTPITRSFATEEWAAVVSIDEAMGSTQEGGISSLKGRLAVVFRDTEKSWVAGRFVADGCRQ